MAHFVVEQRVVGMGESVERVAIVNEDVLTFFVFETLSAGSTVANEMNVPTDHSETTVYFDLHEWEATPE